MFTPDNKTNQMADFLVEIIKAANENSKRILVIGGFAAEIEAANLRGDENLTRNHWDIDIHPMEEDIPFWKNWFTKKGFVLKNNNDIKDMSKGFVAHFKNIFYVDYYGIQVNQDGQIYINVTGRHEPWKKLWQGITRTCVYRGYPVIVMKHEEVIRFKHESSAQMGTPLRDKDIHDEKLFPPLPEAPKDK